MLNFKIIIVSKYRLTPIYKIYNPIIIFSLTFKIANSLSFIHFKNTIIFGNPNCS